jgi:hypothetical protein
MMTSERQPIRMIRMTPTEGRLSNTSFAIAIGTIWMVLFAGATPAFAYVDPGSGGMMMQLLLGGVAGVSVLLRLYWQRFATFIGVRRADAESREHTDR